MFFHYGKDTFFPALGRVHGFMLWADTLLSYFGQGAFFLRRGGARFFALGKAHCFPASGGTHSFNLGGAQGHSCFGRGAFLFWGMAYCFRPRRCALVYPCAYEGLPRLRNEAPEYLLRQSGGCMPRRVRRLAGDAEAVGALACFAHLLDLLFPALRTVFRPPFGSAARHLMHADVCFAFLFGCRLIPDRFSCFF